MSRPPHTPWAIAPTRSAARPHLAPPAPPRLGQVHVHCSERGQLLESILQHHRETFRRLVDEREAELERIRQRAEAEIAQAKGLATKGKAAGAKRPVVPCLQPRRPLPRRRPPRWTL